MKKTLTSMAILLLANVATAQSEKALYLECELSNTKNAKISFYKIDPTTLLIKGFPVGSESVQTVQYNAEWPDQAVYDSNSNIVVYSSHLQQGDASKAVLHVVRFGVLADVVTKNNLSPLDIAYYQHASYKNPIETMDRFLTAAIGERFDLNLAALKKAVAEGDYNTKIPGFPSFNTGSSDRTCRLTPVL